MKNTKTIPSKSTLPALQSGRELTAQIKLQDLVLVIL